ncbi:MAG: type II toxin-antitoxin system RatA family toxin [Burkholderiaceae bacterium]|jgi:ribosome-associated toxin RatA of RatAB toxin-antitoxin module|nr:type II toxin-antitoxin system RatA family toxin [Burkholderiaceae bacterium]
MKSVHKTAIVGYSAEKMYALVADIEKYADFLPWCAGATVQEDIRDDSVLATLFIDFHGLRHSFTTRNRNTEFVSIAMNLEKGPFRQLYGKWTFTPLPEGRSRVDLELNYEFSNNLFEKMLSPIFDMVSITLVDSFHQRARTVYG